jgi:AbrB family looped-hinge helix DNA binding protein
LALGYGILDFMDEILVQIDRAGRVVLPKSLRDRLQLRGGDMLAIKVRGNAIELRPTRPTRQLKRINGVLVFTGGPLKAGEGFVAQSRNERIEKLARDVPKDN